MASILISDDSEPENDSDNLPPFPHNSKSLMAVRTNVPSMRSEESTTKRGRKRKATENEVHARVHVIQLYMYLLCQTFSMYFRKL